MVVTARRLEQGKINNLEQLRERYNSLTEDDNLDSKFSRGKTESPYNINTEIQVIHYLIFL